MRQGDGLQARWAGTKETGRAAGGTRGAGSSAGTAEPGARLESPRVPQSRRGGSDGARGKGHRGRACFHLPGAVGRRTDHSVVPATVPAPVPRWCPTSTFGAGGRASFPPHPHVQAGPAPAKLATQSDACRPSTSPIACPTRQQIGGSHHPVTCRRPGRGEVAVGSLPPRTRGRTCGFVDIGRPIVRPPSGRSPWSSTPGP